MVSYRDATNAERLIGIELASLPEYKRLRSLARQTAPHNRPPFVVVKDTSRESLANWRDLLEYAKTEGVRDAQVQRYKGLGEMNAEQLWDTTKGRQAHAAPGALGGRRRGQRDAQALMGEDVENRRKFIEENALDVRNLDM